MCELVHSLVHVSSRVVEVLLVFCALSVFDYLDHLQQGSMHSGDPNNPPPQRSARRRGGKQEDPGRFGESERTRHLTRPISSVLWRSSISRVPPRYRVTRSLVLSSSMTMAAVWGLRSKATVL